MLICHLLKNCHKHRKTIIIFRIRRNFQIRISVQLWNTRITVDQRYCIFLLGPVQVTCLPRLRYVATRKLLVLIRLIFARELTLVQTSSCIPKAVVTTLWCLTLEVIGFVLFYYIKSMPQRRTHIFRVLTEPTVSQWPLLNGISNIKYAYPVANWFMRELLVFVVYATKVWNSFLYGGLFKRSLL